MTKRLRKGAAKAPENNDLLQSKATLVGSVPDSSTQSQTRISLFKEAVQVLAIPDMTPSTTLIKIQRRRQQTRAQGLVCPSRGPTLYTISTIAVKIPGVQRTARQLRSRLTPHHHHHHLLYNFQSLILFQTCSIFFGGLIARKRVRRLANLLVCQPES